MNYSGLPQNNKDDDDENIGTFEWAINIVSNVLLLIGIFGTIIAISFARGYYAG